MTRGGIGPTVVIWLDELTCMSLSVAPAGVVTSKLVWLKVLTTPNGTEAHIDRKAPNSW